MHYYLKRLTDSKKSDSSRFVNSTYTDADSKVTHLQGWNSFHARYSFGILHAFRRRMLQSTTLLTWVAKTEPSLTKMVNSNQCLALAVLSIVVTQFNITTSAVVARKLSRVTCTLRNNTFLGRRLLYGRIIRGSKGMYPRWFGDWKGPPLVVWRWMHLYQYSTLSDIAFSEMRRMCTPIAREGVLLTRGCPYRLR